MMMMGVELTYGLRDFDSSFTNSRFPFTIDIMIEVRKQTLTVKKVGDKDR